MKKKRVLIVDDYSDFLEMLALLAEHFGYEPIAAKTGRQAIERATNSSPDIIILDLALPDINGLEVVTILKRNPKTSQIPIVILTALVAESWKEAAKSAGVPEVLSKPCSIDKLQRLLAQLVDEYKESSLGTHGRTEGGDHTKAFLS